MTNGSPNHVVILYHVLGCQAEETPQSESAERIDDPCGVRLLHPV